MVVLPVEQALMKSVCFTSDVIVIDAGIIGFAASTSAASSEPSAWR